MHPLLRTLLFTIVVPGTVGILVPRWVAGPATIATSGWRLSGWLPVALGAALYLWCGWNFAMRGRGTPGPWDPPRKLVVSGPYRWLRNPMYVAVGLVVQGQAILYGSAAVAWLGPIFWLCTHLFVVFYEEPTLRKLFGADYEAYCRSVPRWIPRLR